MDDHQNAKYWLLQYEQKTVNNCQRSAQLNWMDFRFALMCLSYIFFSLMFRCCLGYFMHNKPACSIVLFLDLEKSRAQALRWTEYLYEESWSELITIVKSQITQSARRRRRTMTTTEVQHVFKGSGMELWGELLLLQLTFQCLHFSVCFSLCWCAAARLLRCFHHHHHIFGYNQRDMHI